MLVYVSGPYRGKDQATIKANIAAARAVAIKLWEAGHVAICPHLNTAEFEHDCKVPEERYIDGDLSIIARCDALVVVPNGPQKVGTRSFTRPLFKDSQGVMRELEYARAIGVPCYVEPGRLPPLHPTEVRCPTQVRRFAETLGKMYRVHLAKNADYSPANIGGLGTPGVCVRVWDKVCRLLNLTGWQISATFVALTPPKEAHNEPIEDAWLDLANYGVIGYLNHEGSWGR
jgi:hypothetical protein